MPEAVYDKGSNVERASVVCDRHRARCVWCTASCHATRHEWLAGSVGAIQDVYSQNVGRAIRKRSCVGAGDSPTHGTKRDDTVLQSAVFLVHYYWHPREIVTRSEISVSGIVRLHIVVSARQSRSGECCGAIG